MNIKWIPGKIIAIVFFSVLLIASAGLHGDQDNIRYFKSNALFKYLIDMKFFHHVGTDRGGDEPPFSLLLPIGILPPRFPT